MSELNRPVVIWCLLISRHFPNLPFLNSKSVCLGLSRRVIFSWFYKNVNPCFSLVCLMFQISFKVTLRTITTSSSATSSSKTSDSRSSVTKKASDSRSKVLYACSYRSAIHFLLVPCLCLYRLDCSLLVVLKSESY